MKYYKTMEKIQAGKKLNEEKTLNIILELGREMIIAGADVWKAEDYIRRICSVCGFRRIEIWMMISFIEATVQTEDGRIMTQMKSIDARKYDMEKLKLLTRLSEDICLGKTELSDIGASLKAIKGTPKYPKWLILFASLLGAGNFTMFFNGYRQDVMIAGLTAMLIAVLRMRFEEYESNPLILNTILSFIMEVIIIVSMLAGAGRSLESMTSGMILLLISGIGITNGMKDLLHKNTLSGIIDFMNSLLGAMGIAIGISLAMMLFGEDVLEHIQGHEIVASRFVQIIACMGGCVGFGMLFNAKGRILTFSGVGAAVVWISYLISIKAAAGNYFTATLAAAFFASFYGNLAGKITKVPASVYLTTCAFPLIPGSGLYMTVYDIIMDDTAGFHEHGRQVFLICIAIALGYIMMEVILKYAQYITARYRLN